ncbi:type II toxin-antitoxin system VapC family toxin [Haloferula sp.]|uniref:type II toxin-antitoxin system VapC family toxin n=1 Tax=Haloferula sp. TaxID=2497595 RepID=UPI003C774F5B
MNSPTLVDTGAIVALIDQRDRHHAWAKASFRSLSSDLVTCEAVLSESFHLLRKAPNGREILREFLRLDMLKSGFDLNSEQTAVLALLEKYHDTPMDFADACLVRMAETTRDSKVWTIDSDFKIYRLSNRRIVPLLAPWN